MLGIYQRLADWWILAMFGNLLALLLLGIQFAGAIGLLVLTIQLSFHGYYIGAVFSLLSIVGWMLFQVPLIRTHVPIGVIRWT